MAEKLMILAYHRVLKRHDPLRPGDITESDFSKQMQIVSRFFNPVALAEGVAGVQQGNLPARAVAVTFDDGYADNFTTALPILQRHDIPATVFVATGYLDGKRMWNDSVVESVRRWRGSTLDLADIGLPQFDIASDEQKRRTSAAIITALKYQDPADRQKHVDRLVERVGTDLPTDLMLTTDQLIALSNSGVSIGAHTRTHPILQSLDEQAAYDEIETSKIELEARLHRPVRHFAYPNGRPHTDYGAAHVEMVADAGFDCAVSTIQGVAVAACDQYQLPRFGPWAEPPSRFLLRLLRMHWRRSGAPDQQL